MYLNCILEICLFMQNIPEIHTALHIVGRCHTYDQISAQLTQPLCPAAHNHCQYNGST